MMLKLGHPDFAYLASGKLQSLLEANHAESWNVFNPSNPSVAEPIFRSALKTLIQFYVALRNMLFHLSGYIRKILRYKQFQRLVRENFLFRTPTLTFRDQADILTHIHIIPIFDFICYFLSICDIIGLVFSLHFLLPL